jgi:teichuronic acid biosynthesis glycosyltransferase TuaG
MQTDLVSIVTPLHNSERFIRQTIESVRAQTFPNWEMLIVDDCSTDGSVAIVQGLQTLDRRIRLLRLAEHGGPAVARNTGIREAKGRFIIFLDSDDIWFPHLLETEVAFIKSKDAAIVFASYERTTEDLKTNLGPFSVPTKVGYTDLLKTCSISCLTGMYDAGKVGKVYMPNFDKREDYGLWLAILKQGYTAWGLADTLALYRMRKGSVSRNKLHIAYRQWQYYRTEERLPLHECVYYFCCYAANSFKKYII